MSHNICRDCKRFNKKFKRCNLFPDDDTIKENSKSCWWFDNLKSGQTSKYDSITDINN